MFLFSSFLFFLLSPPLLFLYSSYLLFPFSSFLLFFFSFLLFPFSLFSFSFFFFSPFPNWCPMPHQYLKANGAPVLNYELKCFLDHWEFGQTSGTDCCPLVWSIRHFRVWENTISLTTQSDAGDTQTKSPPRHRVLHNAQKNPSPACIRHHQNWWQKHLTAQNDLLVLIILCGKKNSFSGDVTVKNISRNILIIIFHKIPS